MKKKLLLVAIMLMATFCMLAISISAASTNAFGTVETSKTIDLTGMAEDDDVYCVLYDGEEYHTYPSRYIVTNATTMTWNFDKINAAFTKSYTAASVIRIQVPAHVKEIPCITSKYFGWQNVTTLVEVSFPEDTIVETFGGAAFEKCKALESIVIPNTVKTFGHNTFNGCSSLKSVVFEEGSQLTSLPDFAFGSTLALTEIKLPDSITSIGRGILGGHDGKLSKVVLSPNLSKVTGNALLNALGRSNDEFIEVYMPACFATAEGSLESGTIIGRNDTNDLKRYAILYTGTKEQAIAFVTKYSGDNSLYNANIVAYDPTKTSAQEYLGMEPYTTDIEVNTNRVIVYGYNQCKAFYNDVHPEKLEEGEVDTNPCMLTECDRCGITNVYSGNDSTHNMNTVYAYANYFVNGTITESCQNAGCIYHTTPKVDNETLTPFFNELKYSTKEEGAVFGIYVEYKTNQDAIALYEKLSGKSVKYGVMAIMTSNITGNGPLNTDGLTDANYVVAADVTNNKLALAQLIITGDWAGNADIEITMLGYVTNGSELHYMGSQTVEGEAVATTGVAAGAFNAVTYNNIIE